MRHQLYATLILIYGAIPFSAQQNTGILQINNIRCHVSSTGDLFNTFDSEDLPGFEVPSGSGLHTIHSANLWIGGISPDQQLKLAAETDQEEGHDWFTGPLSIDGTASISNETEIAYDQVWTANSSDVDDLIAYFDYLENGGENPFPNGYTIPEWILNWPAMGNLDQGQALFLAPFADHNMNGLYDPLNGDYPLFCGEQCVYFIFNDKGNVHSVSQGQPIGLEVHGMLYGFNSSESDMLNNTIFLKYMIINRGTQTLTGTYLGLWCDFDIGFKEDDFVGTDVLRGAIYGYNGDAYDDDNYGDDLPAQAFQILAGPFVDPDEMDNLLPDSNWSVETMSYGSDALGFADMVTDNERMGLTGSININPTNDPVTGDPASTQDYYSFMNPNWKNGSNLTYGADGTEGNVACQYVYPGQSDPLFLGTFGTEQELWSEDSENHLPGDRRMLASSGPFTLTPGSEHWLDGAFVFARESEDTDLSVLESLDQRLVESKLFFNEFLQECTGQDIPMGIKDEQAMELFVISPNPATDVIHISTGGKWGHSEIAIFSSNGSLVFKSTLLSTSESFHIDLVPGLYTVEVSGAAGHMVKRLMIQ